MDLLYDKHLGDIIISGDKDLRGNRIMDSRGLVLSYLHIDIHTGDAKYRVYPSKKETVTNITFIKVLKGLSLVKIWRLLMMKDQFTYS